MTHGGWLEPSLLLCVWDTGECRAHEIAERLAELGFGDVKLKKIYPVLQKMERDGLVTSDDEYLDWPAWRRYGITASGEGYLEIWVNAFERYRDGVDHFLRLYGERPGWRRGLRESPSVPW